ncbi:MAG: DNA-binding protein WhiA, partial [Clostridia bacterium]|nr:DNA-binding protein WhiA [Clostridia bacterium]
MSFSTNVKNELARIKSLKQCCRLAELSALAKLDGSLEIRDGQVSLKIVNGNAAVARKIFVELKEFFAVQTKVEAERKIKLKKNMLYLIRVCESEKVREILTELGLLSEDFGLESEILPRFTASECCGRAYLRGAFLGGGSINNPEKDYHLEIITTDERYAQSLQLLMQNFNLPAKISRRKNWLVVYLKEGNRIADFLSMVGAHTALLDFENARVLKETRNLANRLANCENANLDKAMEASARQLRAIQIIEEYWGLKRLPPPLRV